MKRKIISIILAFAMLCALVPCIAMAEDVASGVCGTDATWTLDDSGTLTISGNGEIPNNARYEWKDYKKDILNRDSGLKIGGKNLGKTYRNI